MNKRNLVLALSMSIFVEALIAIYLIILSKSEKPAIKVTSSYEPDNLVLL